MLLVMPLFGLQKIALFLLGDQVLPGISPNLGVYPTEPEADTVGDWITSCKKLLRVSDNNKLVLPGHKLLSLVFLRGWSN